MNGTRRKIFSAAIMLAALIFFSLNASASNVIFDLAYSGTSKFNITSPFGTNKDTHTTEFAVTFTSPNWGGPFAAYCIDLANTISAGTYTYQLNSLADYVPSSKIYQAAWIMDNYAPAHGHTAFGFNRENLEAATQLAIWNTIYDTDYNITSGDFRVNTNNDVRGLAQQYLTALETKGNVTEADLTRKYAWLSNAEKQDLLVVTPIPGAVWLLGSALLGLIGLRRKMQS